MERVARAGGLTCSAVADRRSRSPRESHRGLKIASRRRRETSWRRLTLERNRNFGVIFTSCVSVLHPRRELLPVKSPLYFFYFSAYFGLCSTSLGVEILCSVKSGSFQCQESCDFSGFGNVQWAAGMPPFTLMSRTVWGEPFPWQRSKWRKTQMFPKKEIWNHPGQGSAVTTATMTCQLAHYTWSGRVHSVHPPFINSFIQSLIGSFNFLLPNIFFVSPFLPPFSAAVHLCCRTFL